MTAAASSVHVAGQNVGMGVFQNWASMWAPGIIVVTNGIAKIAGTNITNGSGRSGRGSASRWRTNLLGVNCIYIYTFRERERERETNIEI